MIQRLNPKYDLFCLGSKAISTFRRTQKHYTLISPWRELYTHHLYFSSNYAFNFYFCTDSSIKYIFVKCTIVKNISDTTTSYFVFVNKITACLTALKILGVPSNIKKSKWQTFSSILQALKKLALAMDILFEFSNVIYSIVIYWDRGQ